MSRVLQPWKEAATVILAARVSSVQKSRFILGKSGSSPSSPDIGGSQLSATNDFVVLMLERSSRSKFMPNASVFPGGNLVKHDFDRRWGEYLLPKNAKWGNLDVLNLPLINEGGLRPGLYEKDYGYDSDVPPEVAFRICAVRETFEESGVLLYRDQNSGPGPLKEIQPDILQMWQTEVNKTESAFLEMCQDLRILPDIWSLFEWSNWLTPTNMPNVSAGRRFDTQFYLACLPERVQQVHDDKEIISAKWLSPSEALTKFQQGQISLAPPQVYELGRLMNFSDIMSLEAHARWRATQGCSRWMPVRIKHGDGVASVLPGDSAYPDEPDFHGTEPAPEVTDTMQEAAAQLQKLNRFHMTEFYKCAVLCNITDPHGHTNPAQGLSKLEHGEMKMKEEHM